MNKRITTLLIIREMFRIGKAKVRIEKAVQIKIRTDKYNRISILLIKRILMTKVTQMIRTKIKMKLRTKM